MIGDVTRIPKGRLTVRSLALFGGGIKMDIGEIYVFYAQGTRRHNARFALQRGVNSSH